MRVSICVHTAVGCKMVTAVARGKTQSLYRCVYTSQTREIVYIYNYFVYKFRIKVRNTRLQHAPLLQLFVWSFLVWELYCRRRTRTLRCAAVVQLYVCRFGVVKIFEIVQLLNKYWNTLFSNLKCTINMKHKIRLQNNLWALNYWIKLK